MHDTVLRQYDTSIPTCVITPVDGHAEGERLRDAAHSLLSLHRERIVRDAQRALIEQVLSSGTATADDIRAAITLPDGIDPVCLGAVPGSLARRGISRRMGYVPTTRPCAHARPVSVWGLVDHPGAVAWLAAHPPIPVAEGV